jgi:cation diffusion facilitator family transporter
MADASAGDTTGHTAGESAGATAAQQSEPADPRSGESSGDAAGDKDPTQESTATVLLALGANIGVGILKLAAGLVSGSGALLSEAAHSVGDSATEILLLTALRRSDRPADRLHPFGYGKERYFWSLLASVTILVSGGAFSIFQGVHTILSGGESTARLWVNYPVLALAFVIEATSFRQAIGQAGAAARRGRRSVRSYIRDPEDPTVKSVVLEDSAALIGLLFAAIGVGLHELTGDAVYDGVASLAIGLLLVIAAYLLAQTCKTLLIGKQADLRLIQAVSRRLEEQDEVTDVVDLLSMMTGTNRILLCARVDFVDDLNAADLERACVRIDATLSAEFSALDEIFIQPVPRTDPAMRERVLRRYGRVLADEPGTGTHAAAAERSSGT